MKSVYQIIKNPLQTEKGTQQKQQNKYFFVVDFKANKTEIRKSIEDIYNVKVKSVNTQIVPGKPKRVRYKIGKTAEWKKATVTLREGKIDLT
ncbi:MAG: 50S ribosomal protein L23 [Candidatus Omnitrophota bacterium]